MHNLTFRVVKDGQTVFESDQRWLHPLFDLEDYLAHHPLDLSDATIEDKVIGKAAAMLIVRLGAGSVHAQVLSELGRAVFEDAALPYSFDTLVPQIDCQTEELLQAVDDAESAHQILRERANR